MSDKNEKPKSSLRKMEDFTSYTSQQQEAVFNPQVIPDSEDIYWRDERYFLPEGKDFKDLTEEEKKLLKNKFRFSPLRPGKYQGITGMSPMKGTGNMI